MYINERLAFTISGSGGEYAAETITFNKNRVLRAVTLGIEAAPAGAAIELWLLRLTGDPTNAAHYFKYASTTTSATYVLAGYAGAQIRAKSGGTAGTLTASVVGM